MSVAMSAATAVAHERDGHRELARGVAGDVFEESAALCTALLKET